MFIQQPMTIIRVLAQAKLYFNCKYITLGIPFNFRLNGQSSYRACQAVSRAEPRSSRSKPNSASCTLAFFARWDFDWESCRSLCPPSSSGSGNNQFHHQSSRKNRCRQSQSSNYLFGSVTKVGRTGSGEVSLRGSCWLMLK